MRSPEPSQNPALDVTKPSYVPATFDSLHDIVRLTRKSAGTIVREFFRLAFGPGRISFQDYVKLRLFDDERHAAEDRLVGAVALVDVLEDEDRALRGGGGAGFPRMFSRRKSPRLTGDVRVGLDVTASTVPMVSTPPRGLSGGNLTSRISGPVTLRFVSA